MSPIFIESCSALFYDLDFLCGACSFKLSFYQADSIKQLAVLAKCLILNVYFLVVFACFQLCLFNRVYQILFQGTL